MRDNQNRNLEATKKWQEIERANHEIGIAKMEEELRIATFAQWVEIEGVKVLRVANSKFVAAPTSGKKNSRKFDIINIKTQELVCQIWKGQVHNWLMRMAD